MKHEIPTAAGIHMLVKDWPVEAQPHTHIRGPCPLFKFVPDYPDGPVWVEPCGPINDSTAAHAFVGAGLAWLAKQGGSPTVPNLVVIGYREEDDSWCAMLGHLCGYRSLLEAISAAILAAEAAKKGTALTPPAPAGDARAEGIRSARNTQTGEPK